MWCKDYWIWWNNYWGVLANEHTNAKKQNKKNPSWHPTFFLPTAHQMKKIKNQYYIQSLIKSRMICSLTEPRLVATTALEGSVSFNTQMIKLLLSRKVIGGMENGKNMGAHTIGNLQAGFVCQGFANSLKFFHCHFRWWFVNCQTKEICLSDNGEAADSQASNSHPGAPPSEDTNISASALGGKKERPW